MKTSLIVISALLVLSVFVPFVLFIYKGAKNTISIKKQSSLLIKDNGIVYSAKEIWRKNFIGISSDNKVLTYIHFKKEVPFVTNISLIELKECHIVGNYKNSANKAISIKNLDLELVFKSAGKPNLIINFFNIDDDLSEDFELQRIENWQSLIKKAIVEPHMVKMAS
ncbi:hypothetical protein [Confluentibacter lentus]|uniref:hypothetical protein n=1 Tax=Confluentibacter lentus TaxID=1699412 RepID=UPI000C284975|nr:hypothetical protein [Confluentibacter lentus]